MAHCNSPGISFRYAFRSSAFNGNPQTPKIMNIWKPLLVCALLHMSSCLSSDESRQANVAHRLRRTASPCTSHVRLHSVSRSAAVVPSWPADTGSGVLAPTRPALPFDPLVVVLISHILLPLEVYSRATSISFASETARRPRGHGSLLVDVFAVHILRVRNKGRPLLASRVALFESIDVVLGTELVDQTHLVRVVAGMRLLETSHITFVVETRSSVTRNTGCS